MDVRKIFGILDPLPPLIRVLARSIRVNPRNLPYYVCFWANPPSPLGADILYEWSPSRSKNWKVKRRTKVPCVLSLPVTDAAINQSDCESAVFLCLEANLISHIVKITTPWV